MTLLYVAYEDRLLRVQGRDDDWSAETVLADVNAESVAAHPDAPERVFCATFDRGLLRSTDGGETWRRVGADAFVAAAVTAVAVDPTDPAVVYAGTEPSRVYRSADGGDTWDHRDGLADLPSASEWSFPPRPDTHHVRDIAVEPHLPDRLHVAIEAGALVRSFDAGATWTDRVPTARWDVHALETHPDGPHRLWTAAGDGYAETVDGGDTWDHPEAGLAVGYCWSVAVDPDDVETVLVSAASGPQAAHRPDSAESFVFRMRDHNDWTPVGGGLPTGEGVLRYALAGGTDPGEFFAASNTGLFHSADGGDTWRSLDLDLPAALASRAAERMAVLP